MQDIVIFGVTQFAEIAKSYIEAEGRRRVVGFTVDAAYLKTDTFLSLPVVPWESLERHFPPDRVQLLGPLSYARLNELRQLRYLEGKQRGYAFASFIHPSCQIAKSEIGENCFMLEFNIIQPFSRIGHGVILWSANHIGHHAQIGDFCFMASHVAIGGGSVLGERCFVGGQVGIESHLKIGNASFIGAGSIIRKDLAEQSVVRGPKHSVAEYSSLRIKHLKFR